MPLPTAIPSPSLCPCGENDKVRGAGAWEAEGPFRRDPALPSPSPGADSPCPWALLATAQLGGIAGMEEGRETTEERSPRPQDRLGLGLHDICSPATGTACYRRMDSGWMEGDNGQWMEGTDGGWLDG